MNAKVIPDVSVFSLNRCSYMTHFLIGWILFMVFLFMFRFSFFSLKNIICVILLYRVSALLSEICFICGTSQQQYYINNYLT